MSQKKINEEVLNWYATCENKGISSETLANTATHGVKTAANRWGAQPPSDNSDFGRCVLFKEMCPIAFKMAKKILKNEPVWDEYFKNWSKMEELLELQKLKKNDGMELYSLMSNIQLKAREKSAKA